jgi:hypothetical protein
MSENLPFTPDPGGGPGVSLRKGRTDVVLAQRAVRAGWPVTPEMRQALVDEALDIALHSRSERRRLGAMKFLLACDAVNVQREAREPPGPDPKAMAALDELRAALATPEGCDTLLRISNQLSGTLLPSPQAPRAGETEHPGGLTPLDQVPGVGSPGQNGSAPEPGPGPTTAGRQRPTTEPPPTPPPERRGPLIIDPFGEIPRW